MLDSVIGFLAVSALVICTPGQDTALTVGNTLGEGRRAGVATAAGVAIGQLAWTLAASLGVVALLTASDAVFHALKLAGAAYLIALGVMTITAGIRAHERAEPARCQQRRGGRRALRQGLVSNLGNPKMALFFASLLPQFASGEEGTSFVALMALGAIFCVMTFGWLSLYAVAVARFRHLLVGAARRVLEMVTGIALVTFGVRLASE